ncbi:MAG TPA: type II toxin-antitoxin system prevent-host-death family antitoxin, partial [Longimicrobiales bacterium]|nr:type II toxin-antitoxin system prevent-host-death family antitoxin [Longimicrobiales bacterium]
DYHGHMGKDERVASIAQLKARLSHYLRLVRRGDRVTVTHRGRPVATLGPVGTEATDARLRRLIESGVARPPGDPLPPGFWDVDRPADPEGRSLAGLLEERAEAR